MNKVAIVFLFYNHFNKPNMTKWANNIYAASKHSSISINLIADQFLDSHPDHVVVLGNQIGRIATVKAFISNCLKWPTESVKWLLKMKTWPFKNRVIGWSRYAPLILSKPKVIHMTSAFLYSQLFFYIKQLGCISIATFRGYELKSLNKRYLSKLFNECDYLHFISKGFLRQAIELGAPYEKCVVIYPGVDVDFYQINETRVNYSNNNSLTLMTVGRLVPEKGIQNVFRALKILIDDNYKVRYFVVGEGPFKNNLILLAKELKITDYVLFHGYLSPEDIKILLKETDIYLQPSLFEALCMASIEASAMGLPIIASNVGGLPEVVDDNISGILVPPNDSAAIVEAIRSLAQDSEKRNQMGKNARKRALNNFSLERETKEWMSFYRKLIL